jgi:hypothetical protein
MYNNMMNHLGWILRINTGALEHNTNLNGGFDLETTYRLYICFVKFHGGVGILGMISIEISQLWFQEYVIIIN